MCTRVVKATLVHLSKQKNKNMKNIYLIFVDINDVSNYCKIECERKDFINSLIENELIESEDDIKILSLIIFENGNMIDFSNFWFFLINI